MPPLDINHITDTPAIRRRKLVPALPKLSPNKLSDLLSVFGARKSLTSVTKMDRDAGGHSLRGKEVVSYAESPNSSPERSRTSSASFEEVLDQFEQADEEPESEDELTSDDVIHAVPRGTLQRQQQAPVAELPVRARRPGVTYTRPVPQPAKQSNRVTKRKSTKRILTSDTNRAAVGRPHVDTARNVARQDILRHTKPKRDAFLVANKDYFLPLLPANNYIAKLATAQAKVDAAEPLAVPYVELREQPKAVTAVMKPYQLQGLSFLVSMHDNGMSAILGDEMGLGKTLQTLALFQYLVENRPTQGEHRPNLVVCPLSVLSSWVSEAKKWVPGLNVVRFHGPKSERERIKKECLEKKTRSKSLPDRMDLFITTYETFAAEDGWFKRAFVWRYCVLDEGHKIKNDKSDIATTLQGLSAEYRLLLTGTPLQNNLKEMWALLHWLFPEVFTKDTEEAFRKAFDLTKGKVSTSFMDDARLLLELVMLRRMKSTPGVNLGLPPKEEVLLFVPLTPMQRFWYTRLLTKTDNATLESLFAGAKDKESDALTQQVDSERLALLERAGAALESAEQIDNTEVWAESREIMQQALQSGEADKKNNTWKKLMNLLMQLRKVCNHPYLVSGAAPDQYDIGDHVIKASGKFLILDKLIDELVIKQGKKVLIFSGFTKTLNLCEELFACKGANTTKQSFRHARLDGSTNRAQRNLSIRLFNDMKSDYRVMLLSTRAGGLGINLTSATEVVFMDDDWNPQVTLQAEARAHRIGQTKKVTIYKLCTQGTVEEQMMGRIRKKLYLSAKITESMRNIHTTNTPDKKRKRQSNSAVVEDDAPHLDTASLQSLLRRGAQTLARPEIKVEELLSWDWETTIEKCKDKPLDAIEDANVADREVDEQQWLNSMEKVECAVFEGKKHQKALEKKVQEVAELSRADRREGKNTTVEIDGFMINKESLACADWEAVPTFAGKDPRLAEPKREKKAAIEHQEFCQNCWDGGDLVCCSGCPRSYHVGCLGKEHQAKAKSKMGYHCSQHECHDCGAKTTDAGGMIFRCRWCTNGFCEECLDWDETNLLGDTLPEYEMLGFGKVAQAFYIECPDCVGGWKVDDSDRVQVEKAREDIQSNYEQYLESIGFADEDVDGTATTPDTVSEIATPAEPELPSLPRSQKKAKTQLKTLIDLTSDLTEFTSDAREFAQKRSSPRSAKKQVKAPIVDLTSELTEFTSDVEYTPRSAKKVRR